MSPMQRKVMLLQKGVSLEDIRHGLKKKRSLPTISRIISGKQRAGGDEIREVTARLCHCTPHEMFGS